MSKKNSCIIVRKFTLLYLHFTALQFMQDSSEKMQDSTPIYAAFFGVYILIKNIYKDTYKYTHYKNRCK